MPTTVVPIPGPQTIVLSLNDITAVGPPGPQGAQGLQGIQGPTGPIGPPLQMKGTVASHTNLPASGNTVGDVWITADTGHAWSWNGTSWIDCGQFQGPQGATGAQGPVGPVGPGSTVTAGPTTTGAAGTNASVTNIGSPSAAIFSFTIPQGIQGVAGPQGSQGVVGPQGNVGAVGPVGPPGPPLNAKGTVANAAALPATANQGDLYITNDTGHAWIWNATAFVDSGPFQGPIVVSTDTGNQARLGSDNRIFVAFPLPSGVMMDFAGASAPSGWLLCDGTAYSTTLYPALFAAIGYTFGGSGGTFSVPDCRSRTIVGAGQASGLTNRALGAVGGEENHTLAVAELASHTHSLGGHSHGMDHYHTIGAGQFNHNHGVSDPQHGHWIDIGSYSNGAGGSGIIYYGGLANGLASHGAATGISIPANTLPGGNTVYASQTNAGWANTGAPSGGSDATGSGSGHNNMPPFITLNRIIKT